MNALLPLLQLKSKQSQSYSILIDIYQYYVRNIVLFCTGLSMVRTLFSETIICQNTVNVLSQAYIDTRCFINGTMTREDGSIIYHDYYQWVSVYLFLVAVAFHIPYAIWSKYIGHYIRYLEKLTDKPDDAIQIIKESKGNLIFLKTVALEIFYTFYLFFIVVLTDLFFNKLWSLNNWLWTAVYKIFPDTGDCFFEYNYSSGSTIGKFRCLLPLCSIYRKIFISLYFIFLLLNIFNILIISYHLMLAIRRRKYINICWAYMIVDRNSLSWTVKKKLKIAFNETITNNQREIKVLI